MCAFVSSSLLYNLIKTDVGGTGQGYANDTRGIHPSEACMEMVVADVLGYANGLI